MFQKKEISINLRKEMQIKEKEGMLQTITSKKHMEQISNISFLDEAKREKLILNLKEQ